MNDIVVRIAGDADLAVLISLRREWAEEEGAGPDDAFEDAFAAWWRAEGTTRTFFVVEVGGEAVGMGNVKTYSRMPRPGAQSQPEAWGYVGNVYVRAAERNRGIGERLMEALTAWSWEQGFDKLRLSPNPPAVPFYERLGFQQSALLQLDA